MNFKICNETIHSGEKVSMALPLPEIFSCAPLYMPVKVINGKKEGPCLLLTAAMYGNEISGTEIIHRLIKITNPKKLSGTIIAVPALNIFGLVNRSRFLPGGINLDRCFPGKKNGTHAARMANLFTEEIFNLADTCIDLQTGDNSFTNLPQVFVNYEDKEATKLAKSFMTPVVSNVACEKGMLKTQAFKRKKPFITYQGGEANRFDDNAIRVGIKGINNVMQALGMLESTPSKKKNGGFTSLQAEKNVLIHAPTSGIVRSKLKLGQRVNKNDILCVIEDPFGVADSITIKAPDDAIVVGKNNLPLVHEGESLLQLAFFNKIERASINMKQWNSAHSSEKH